MKPLFIVILSTLALWTVAVPTNAQNGSSNRQSTPVEENLEPVTLVQLADQGYFADQGIPSHGALKTAIASGEVDAETLVRSAISKGRLSANTINDTGYLNIVRTQLENLNDR
jgi:hypothetical protein